VADLWLKPTGAGAIRPWERRFSNDRASRIAYAAIRDGAAALGGSGVGGVLLRGRDASSVPARFSILRGLLARFRDADRNHHGSPLVGCRVRLQLPVLDLVRRIGLLFRRTHAGGGFIGTLACVYGFAVTPLGFTADFGRRHRLYPFLQTNEGIVASSEPIPINVIGATGLNFLIDVGGGVRIKTGQRRAISLGYKFLHISNGFTSAANPGVDNNVFYAGFSILR
jgi:hypothetical protein